VLKKHLCVNGDGCTFICGGACPVNRTGKECIILGEDNKPIINEELCVGCGICPHKCPVECINIINLPEALKQDPIHRFGKNEFSLYSLPTPSFGKVVGILGRNGIGKSTAIKIIAGVLKPNLNKEDYEANYSDLVQFFKGTEAQTFFEKLDQGEIKVSYKPQNVDLIPKNTKGKVKDLLEKVDERGLVNEISEKLDIKRIFDNDVATISGGELQRVAIAATLLKKANLYIFDEPTSYLDIKQRLNVSKIIRELANEETAVLVIEHDLIALDFMTDLVHIMYGKEGCYGIVSLPKVTKAGINVYLEGYLKEENIRFRNNKIKFEVKAPPEKVKEHMLTEWPELSVKLGVFSLKAEPGIIAKHEVVGVLGENGIGKTSFVKMLAGVVKPDDGKVDEDITVSYKPQYIDSSSEELVVNVLSKVIQKHTNDIITPLNIKPLFMKKICNLSGGELQRVAIASALGKKSKLVLLDEPSAYLDVEQRLIVSKMIRNFVDVKGNSALVVDHDLLFLDYISNRLLVFEGEPAVNGLVKGPFEMETGMNSLLELLKITLRRDEHSHRPRINKENSVKDREQKSKGKYYYG